MAAKPVDNRLHRFLDQILICQQSRSRICREMHDVQRFSLSTGGVDRQLSSGTDFVQNQNQRAVGISHVPVCANRIGTRRGFSQRILRRNHAIFGTPSLRTPAANFQVENEGFIKGRTINACLSAGDNFDSAIKRLTNLLHSISNKAHGPSHTEPSSDHCDKESAFLSRALRSYKLRAGVSKPGE